MFSNCKSKSEKLWWCCRFFAASTKIIFAHAQKDLCLCQRRAAFVQTVSLNPFYNPFSNSLSFSVVSHSVHNQPLDSNQSWKKCNSSSEGWTNIQIFYVTMYRCLIVSIKKKKNTGGLLIKKNHVFCVVITEWNQGFLEDITVTI